jgi:hypothetical protein
MRRWLRQTAYDIGRGLEARYEIDAERLGL